MGFDHDSLTWLPVRQSRQQRTDQISVRHNENPLRRPVHSQEPPGETFYPRTLRSHDRTLAQQTPRIVVGHHFAQVRMKPPFSEAELDDIANRVKNACA